MLPRVQQMRPGPCNLIDISYDCERGFVARRCIERGMCVCVCWGGGGVPRRLQHDPIDESGVLWPLFLRTDSESGR